MATAENILDSTRNFLTPDSVKKFSLALDEPTDKVHAGLQTIVPTLMTGIINEGSTSEGAEKIVHLMESENLDGTIPNNLNDENYLSRGETVIEDIFGEDSHTIASRITPSTGLDTKNMEKLMEMAAPAVLGVIGSKIKEDLNAKTLSGFFQQQKSLTERFQEKKKIPFIAALAGLLLVLAGALWFFSRSTLPVARMERDLAAIERSVSPSTTAINTTQNGLSVEDLSAFLATATAEDLPKRFTVKTLSFIPGTTDMRTGGDRELSLMAASLKRYPKATASLEAYIEDTGDADENLLLSENRAMLVREELIGRGIEPSRIRAEGRGPKSDENQLYFVIIDL